MWQIHQNATQATPYSSQTIRALFQLPATIHQESHMFKPKMSMLQETSHSVALRQTEANNYDTRSIKNNPTADAKGNTNAEANSYCSFKGKQRNHILLARALVEVKNTARQYVSCRTLLVSASQSHFITERCVLRLRLLRNRTNTSIQGICDVNTATHQCFNIFKVWAHRLAYYTWRCCPKQHYWHHTIHQAGHKQLEDSKGS
jgi:hypothetical protein